MSPKGIWTLAISALFFLSSCASIPETRQPHTPPEKHQTPPIVREKSPPAEELKLPVPKSETPPTEESRLPVPKEKSRPAENLPQIGTRQASIATEKPHPPILITLKKRAEEQIQSKNLDAAFSTLEQALGIDAQDPLLWHLMAGIKLSQGNLKQAENLAKKSNLLAAHTPSLQKKNWKIIAKSLELQGKTQEAAAAQKKGEE